MHIHTVLVIALFSGLLDERTAFYTVKLCRKVSSYFYVSIKRAHTNATRLIFCEFSEQTVSTDLR